MAGQLKMTLEQYRSQEVMRYGPHFYLKSPEEMEVSAKRWGVDLQVTNEIADKCKARIELGKYHPPVFDPSTAPDYLEFLEWKKTKLGK
jgi:DNA polymerase III alpha subunit